MNSALDDFMRCAHLPDGVSEWDVLSIFLIAARMVAESVTDDVVSGLLAEFLEVSQGHLGDRWWAEHYNAD